MEKKIPVGPLTITLFPRERLDVYPLYSLTRPVGLTIRTTSRRTIAMAGDQ